jgi:hypothetical protein
MNAPAAIRLTPIRPEWGMIVGRPSQSWKNIPTPAIIIATPRIRADIFGRMIRGSSIRADYNPAEGGWGTEQVVPCHHRRKGASHHLRSDSGRDLSWEGRMPFAGCSPIMTRFWLSARPARADDLGILFYVTPPQNRELTPLGAHSGRWKGVSGEKARNHPTLAAHSSAIPLQS